MLALSSISPHTISFSSPAEVSLFPLSSVTSACRGQLIEYTCHIAERNPGFLQWILRRSFSVLYFEGASLTSGPFRSFTEITVSLDEAYLDQDTGNYVFMSTLEATMTERLSGSNISCGPHTRSLALASVYVCVCVCVYMMLVSKG